MQQQTITWYKPNEMPESWKDGRDLLCMIKSNSENWCEILYYYNDDDEELFIGRQDAEYERRLYDVELILDLDEMRKLTVL